MFAGRRPLGGYLADGLWPRVPVVAAGAPVPVVVAPVAPVALAPVLALARVLAWVLAWVLAPVLVLAEGSGPAPVLVLAWVLAPGARAMVRPVDR